MENGIVMLYSGGADSLLMLKLALMAGREPHCVLIDYGQKHIDELNFAKEQLDNHDVSFQVVKISGMNIDSGLTGNNKESRWENVNAMNVPGRNTIFLGIALGVAENLGFSEVWYGADYEDRINNFPDCTQEYVVSMNEVTEISGSYTIKIVAPLLGMNKELIKDILHGAFEYDITDMYSGYEKEEVVEENQEIDDEIDDEIFKLRISNGL